MKLQDHDSTPFKDWVSDVASKHVQKKKKKSKVVTNPVGGVDLEEGQVKSLGWMVEQWWSRGL